MRLSASSNSYLDPTTQPERSASEVSNHSAGKLGSRAVSHAEKEKPLTDQEKFLGGVSMDLVASRSGPHSIGCVHIFRVKEHLDLYRHPNDKETSARVRKIYYEVYPALESALMNEKIKRPDQEKCTMLALGEPIMLALGYKFMEGDRGTYFTYPDRDALMASWNEIRSNPQHKLYKENLPNIRVCKGDGIASDREFVIKFLRYDALLSSKEEFIHDQDAHVKRMLRFAWTQPELYQEYRSWHLSYLTIIVEYLDAKKKEGCDKTYLEEMWLICGLYVDFISSKSGSDVTYTNILNPFDYHQCPEVDYWKKRTGEFPDVYSLSKRWRELLSDCLSPEVYESLRSDFSTTLMPLVHAARYGRIDIIKFILEKTDSDMRKEVLTQQDYNPTVPLYEAAKNDRLECLELLIAYGAELDQQQKEDGWTALMIASAKGNEQCVEKLIEFGAKHYLISNDDVSAVYLAAKFGHAGCLKLLLKNGAKADSSDLWNSCPLLIAAENGHTECVKLLLEYGANPNQYCLDKEVTPFYKAVQNGHKDCVELFLNNGGTPNNICANKRVTALQLAKDLDRVDCVEILEKAQAASER